MVERFAAFTLDELEAHSNAFEELVIRGLHLAVDRSVERAYDQGIIVAAPVSDTPEDETPDVAPAEFLAFIRQYWGEYVAEVLIPWLLELMNTAGQAQFSGLTDAFNINITPDTPADDPARGVFTPELIDQPLASERYLAQASNRLVNVGDDLWERARTELNEGIEKGESIPQLADRVREAASLEENRSRVTARTEANGAANTSAYEVNQRVDDLFPEVDGGISKQWSATHDLRTRKSHRDADGQTVGLDEPFRVGTASLAYPSDPAGPPGETIQCRCTMLTVISDEVIALAGGTPGGGEGEEPITAATHAFHLPGRHNQKSHANRFRNGVQIRGIDSMGRDIITGDTPVDTQKSYNFRQVDYDAMVNEYRERLDSRPDSGGKLTTDQQQALDDYTRGGYGPMQRALRDAEGDLDQVSDRERGRIDNVINAIDAAGPTSEPYTVFRGVGDVRRTFGEAEPEPGYRVRDTAFGSTSANADVARDFAHSPYAGDVPGIMEIELPPGSPALPVRAVYDPDFGTPIGSASEEELLLPPGMVFEVVEFTSASDGEPAYVKVRASAEDAILTAASTAFERLTDYRRRVAENGDETKSTPVFVVIADPSVEVDEEIDDELDVIEASGDAHTNTALAEGENMPYDIVQGGGDCADSEWAVVKQGTGESVGCHETEESAQEQVAAIMASEAEANGESSDSPDQTGARSSTSGFDVAPVDQPTGDTDVDRGRFATWSGVIAVEGVPTGDGRQFEHGALTWADLPMPLGWMYERSHGGMATDKVTNVGMIDEIQRGEGGIIVARGRIDLRTERGWDVASMMGTREQPGSLAGVSIDADDPEDPMGLDVEYVFPEGCELPDASAEAANDIAEDAVEDVELDMKCMMPELAIYHSGRIRAATMVDIPAFVEARIYLDQPLDDGDEGELHDVVSVDDSEDEVVTAASYTMTLTDIPPVSWFEEPVDEPDIGAITVTDEGRIFGYLAPKHVAHRGIRDKRVEVPMKNVDYGIWMNRVTIADDGRGGFTRVATGPITMDCGHAPMSNRVVGAARRAHYDNSCSVVATARVGENARGVWIAGAILPDVTPEQVRRMMALQLSGDWGPHREQPGKRELAGALLVPVPGYPKRSFSTMSVQKGVLNRVTVPLRFAVATPEQRQEWTFGIRRAADRIAASIGRDRMSRVHELATRVRGDFHGV